MLDTHSSIPIARRSVFTTRVHTALQGIQCMLHIVCVPLVHVLLLLLKTRGGGSKLCSIFVSSSRRMLHFLSSKLNHIV